MKKLRRIITSLMLAMVLCVSTVMPAMAAGTETWYADHNGNYVDTYTVTNYNWTPIKTMGDAGNLVIFGDFVKADSGSSNVKLTIKIVDASTKKVLDSSIVNNTNYPKANMFFTTAKVSKGQKIQIFTDVSSVNNPPGFYRSAKITTNAYIA